MANTVYLQVHCFHNVASFHNWQVCVKCRSCGNMALDGGVTRGWRKLHKDKIKEADKGRECRAQGRDRMFVQNCGWGNLKGNDLL